MSARYALAALPLLLSLAACDAVGADVDGATGLWAGTAEFKVDTLMADQNFRVITDYETRFEFDLVEDEDGLVIGTLSEYYTGTFTLREPRGGTSGPAVVEQTFTWDDERGRTWPVYGTSDGSVLELDLPEAEREGTFPKDIWTFTRAGSRARLANTRIRQGREYKVFENDDQLYRVTLSPTNEREFSIRRQ